ncbi:MAG: hypothetical protein U1F83_00520 [Verrucomicrobiota bacterium]
MKFPVAKIVCSPGLSLGVILSFLMTRESFGWSLLPAVQVDATGIYLDQVVAGASADVPHLRLAPAPALGRPLTLNPNQLTELLQQSAPELVTTNWSAPRKFGSPGARANSPKPSCAICSRPPCNRRT